MSSRYNRQICPLEFFFFREHIEVSPPPFPDLSLSNASHKPKSARVVNTTSQLISRRHLSSQPWRSSNSFPHPHPPPPHSPHLSSPALLIERPTHTRNRPEKKKIHGIYITSLYFQPSARGSFNSPPPPLQPPSFPTTLTIA